MRFILISLAIMFGIIAAHADVSGIVRNAESEPVQGASVVLLELPDSTYINGALSAADGTFTISGDKAAAKYLITVQAFGYEPALVNVDNNREKPLDIQLALSTTELGEVVVRGKAPVTTREGNKYIFIPNNLAEAVSSARNLMSYVPLVSWNDTEVSITGKGASKVYLNGKDPHWETVEISAMLRTLDPKNIKRVEIITEPGASQSASYSGGIINIIYDDPSQGLKGNLLVNSSLENDNPTVMPNIWLNYSHGRFKSSANLLYMYKHAYSHTTDTYDYVGLGRTIVNDSKASAYSHDVQGKLNLSYDLTPRSVLGASLYLGGSESHGTSTVNTVTTESGGNEASSKMKQTSDTPMDNPYLKGLLYYTLGLDNKGSMIDIYAAYSITNSDNYIRNLFNETEDLQTTSSDAYAFSGKADYMQVFNRFTRLNAGIEFIDLHSKTGQVLNGANDLFKYNDRQLHGYVQFSRRWSNVLSTNVGLRVENTHTQGNQMQDNVINTQDYTDFFPSFAVSWNIPKGNQALSLTYDKFISRPSIHMLNPYKYWSSDNTYSQGNPYLKPEYSHSVGLSYSFLSKFILRTRYFYSSQLNNAYTINNDEGYTVTSYTNTGRVNRFSASISFDTSIKNFWMLSASASAGYFNIKTRAEGHNIHSSSWDFSLHQRNTFLLSRRNFLSAQLSQMLTSPSDRGTYKENWRYVIYLGLQKSFKFGLDANLTVGLPITGYKNRRELYLPDYSYKTFSHNHQYMIQLSLSYAFGKQQVSGAQDRTGEIK